MHEPIFRLEHVTYRYPGGMPALDDISFTVFAGERVAILGANASGKSTLLRLLDGLYFPTAGSVTAFGTRLSEAAVDAFVRRGRGRSPDRPAGGDGAPPLPSSAKAETPPFSRQFRQQVGFLFQSSDAQLFNARVEDELAFGPLQLGLSPPQVQQRVDDVLRMLGIEHLRDRSPLQLSEGEKKKVAVGSLLTVGPRVLLLDEPSSGLDPRSQQWLVEFLDRLHSSGVTLVIATHDLALVGEVADRALVLSEKHRLACDAAVEVVLADLDLLLAVNLIHAHAHAHGYGRTAVRPYVHAHPHRHDAGHEHARGE